MLANSHITAVTFFEYYYEKNIGTIYGTLCVITRSRRDRRHNFNCIISISVCSPLCYYNNQLLKKNNTKKTKNNKTTTTKNTPQQEEESLVHGSPRKASNLPYRSPHLNYVLLRPCFRAPNDRRHNGSQSHFV